MPPYAGGPYKHSVAGCPTFAVVAGCPTFAAAFAAKVGISILHPAGFVLAVDLV